MNGKLFAVWAGRRKRMKRRGRKRGPERYREKEREGVKASSQQES
jgi:hypothetical protein